MVGPSLRWPVVNQRQLDRSVEILKVLSATLACCVNVPVPNPRAGPLIMDQVLARRAKVAMDRRDRVSE